MRPIHGRLILVLMLLSVDAFAASSGPNSPGTVVDDSAVGTTTWNTAGSASAQDDTFAAAANPSSSFTTHYLKATNFGFAIPDSTVDGIVVEYDKHRFVSPVIKDVNVKLVKADTTIATTNQADTVTNWNSSDTDTYISYGSSSDTWGETLTEADVNDADFGVVISAISSASCVLSGTLISTPTGATKIEDILVGDSILSFDEKTKEVVVDKVVAKASIKAAVALKIKSGSSSVKVTPTHEIYTSKGYKLAGEINPGDFILLNESLSEVNSVHVETGDFEAYDIAVEKNHNFFANNILVHNVVFSARVDHVRMTVYYTEGGAAARRFISIE